MIHAGSARKTLGRASAYTYGFSQDGYPLSYLASFIADFANNQYYSRNAALNTPWSSIANPFTVSSGANGTRTNVAGALELVAANTLRLTYDPVTHRPQGCIIEEQRTNRLLNSLIDGTNLTTQIAVVVNATVTTLSFYGTGTVTLTGAANQVVVGLGAYPTRTTATFTTISTALTCTVTGTVQYAQVESGAFASTFIPTAGATVARVADVVTMALGSEFNNPAFTILAQAIAPALTVQATAMQLDDGTDSNRVFIYRSNTGGGRFSSVTGGIAGAIGGGSPWTANTQAKIAVASPGATYRMSQDGGAIQNPSGNIPTVTTLRIGRVVAGTAWNSSVALVVLYPMILSDAQLQAAST